MATASDVPNKFDVVINGEGYLHADAQDVKGEYGYTPTFVNRQNTQGDYGDNQQDFWLTATQRDWGLGEGQRYFRPGDDDSKRRYWIGTNVNVAKGDGQVWMASANGSGTLGATPVYWRGTGGQLFYVTATNLHSVSSATDTDKGAHGAGGAPATFAHDGKYLYMSGGGATKVRKWDFSATFSDFSATPCDGLAFLNNTLYGIRYSSGDLIRYDTAGTVTSLFTWKGADGSAGIIEPVSLVPYGGKLIILVKIGAGYSLWIYDGTAPSKIADLDPNFTPSSTGTAGDVHRGLVVAQGQLFVPGVITQQSAYYACVWYYANGTSGYLWKNETDALISANPPTCVPWATGIAIFDSSLVKILYWNPATGGVSTIANTGTGATSNIETSNSVLYLLNPTLPTAYQYYPTTATSSTATITTSLFDFDSSLAKTFRGVKVEFDPAGGTETVDISYRVGDTDGSYTSLQTAAVSGTEYTLSNVTGRSISIKVTLHLGNTVAGPVLKRVSVRAAPQQPGFKKFTLVLQLAGTKTGDGGQMMRLRDDRFHTKSGEEMADNLFTAAAATAPFAVTTELHGTISACLIDQENFKIQRIRKNEYIAYVPVREV